MLEVVIPAYNAAVFLRETLASIAGQTAPPGLVSVVDDRSTDGTPAIVQEFAGRLPIRLLRNEGPRGPSAARNTAIRQSTAQTIALLDADDLLEPDHHARLQAALSAAPDIVLAFGDHCVFRDDTIELASEFARSGIAAAPAEELAPGLFTLGETMFAAMLESGVFGTSACLFRREAALAAGLMDESMMYGEDTDFFLRLSLQGRFAFTRARVTRKRAHTANLTLPANKLRFQHGLVKSLTKFLDPAQAPKLSGSQSAALRAALPRVVYGHLYAASRTSWGAYAQAARMARVAGHGAMALSPKHLARLALRPLLAAQPAS